MDKLTRGIDKGFAEVFKASEAYGLLQDYSYELFLGIRNDYINMYYRGLSICKGRKVCDRFEIEIAKRYLDSMADQGYETISPVELVRYYDQIKKNINDNYAEKRKEKDAQQRLVNNNNANLESAWVCVDVEYTRENAPGRFNIIAITKTYPHRVALIELKYGATAMGGSSGILKHAEDYLSFLKAGDFGQRLIPELSRIMRSYGMFDYIGNPYIDTATSDDGFSRTPGFYFITLKNDDDRARGTMRRYLWNNVHGAARDNVMYMLGLDITKANKENFTPVFLFSDSDGSDIVDIISNEKYNIGLD